LAALAIHTSFSFNNFIFCVGGDLTLNFFSISALIFVDLGLLALKFSVFSLLNYILLNSPKLVSPGLETFFSFYIYLTLPLFRLIV
jgi:hypothetical protein